MGWQACCGSLKLQSYGMMSFCQTPCHLLELDRGTPAQD